MTALAAPPKPLTRGKEVIRWIQAYCVIPDGPDIGKLFIIPDWWKQVICEWYEMIPDGAGGLRRRYSQGLIGIPKKNLKTSVAAAMALYELAGSEDPAALVLSAASTEDQGSNLLYGSAKTMALQSPHLKDALIAMDKEISVPSQPRARMRNLTNKAGSQDGLNARAIFCVAEGQMLMTTLGPKPIEAIRAGDYVLGWGAQDVNYYRVTAAIETGILPVVQTELRGLDLVTTSDHPLLVSRSRLSAMPRVIKWDTPESLVTKGLTHEKDRIHVVAAIVPSDVRTAPNGRELTEGFMEFLGLFLGDGCLSDSRIDIAHDKDEAHLPYYLAQAEAAFLKRAGKPIRWAKSKGGNASFFCSRSAVREMRELGFGAHAAEKTVPAWVFTVAPDLRRALVRGYLDSDGHVSKLGNMTFVSVSRELLEGIRQLIWTSTGFPAVGRILKGPIGGYENGKACFRYSASADHVQAIGSRHPLKAARMLRTHKKLRRSVYAEGTAELPVVDVQPLAKPVAVYDLAIENAFTFFANGVLCHNCDELHEWSGVSGRRLFAVLEGALTSRPDATFLSITTAGYDEDSICYEKYDYGKRVQLGLIDDPRFYFKWLEAPDGCDYRDRKYWLIANPLLGVTVHESVLEDRVLRDPESVFRRYHLNQWVSGEDIWIPSSLWDAGKHPEDELRTDLPVHVGIDVGIRHDSSAVEVAQYQPETGRTVVRSRVWENPYPRDHSLHDTWSLQIEEIEQYLRDLFELYPEPACEVDGVTMPGPQFSYDPFFFERSAQMLTGEGLTMVEFPQSDQRMIPASQTLHDVIVEGRLSHNGDPILRRHILSAIADQKARGWRLSKPKGSQRKIDAAIAAAIAVYTAQQSNPEEQESVYETRGVVVI